MMTVLRVFDTDAESGRLLGVDRLLALLLQLQLVSADGTWVIDRGAWGYGTWICGLEDELEKRDRLDVLPTRLLRALDEGEYFYDVSIEVVSDPPVRVGLVDSSFLFVEGPPPVIAAVAAEFASTETVE